MDNLFILQCKIILIILGLEMKYSQCFWSPSYQVDLKDKQTFVISSDEDYDEFLEENFHPIKESDSKEGTEFFIKGLKHNLNKYEFENLEKKSQSEDTTVNNSFKILFFTIPINKNSVYVNNNHERLKRSNEEDSFESSDSSTDFFEGSSNENFTTEETIEDEEFTTTKIIKIQTTDSDEYLEEESTLSGEKEIIDLNQFSETSSEIELSEDYDYDKLKAEYDFQIQEMQRRNEIFNYTDQEESNETLEDTVKKIIDFQMPKNCSKAELSQIGAKSFECLIYDFQHTNNKTEVKNIFTRTWIVIKIWVIVYFLLAIPCWCQKGWCCCCFCCEICSPEEIIRAEKRYFAENPPGILMRKTKIDGKMEMKSEEYKPSLFEYEAYEQMESELRNI